MLNQMHAMGALGRSATTALADVARGHPARHAQVALVYLAIYLPLEWVTHIHALEGIGITLWNPSPTVGVALLLTRGFVYTPLLYVAALLASLIVHGGPLSLPGRLLSCTILALGYTGLAFVLRRQRVYDVLQGSLNEMLRLLLLVPAGALAIAVLHSAVLVLTGDLSKGQVVVATTHFWIGDTVGIITLLPALMAVLVNGRNIKIRFDRILSLEIAIFVAGVVAALWLIFSIQGADDHQFFYLLFLPVTWIAVRRGLVGAALAVLVTHVALVLATEAVNYPTAGFMAFQLLMLALAAMTLLLGALVTDRRRWHEEVKAQQAQLSRITRFSAGGAMGLAVAHQISQPLSTLGSYLHIALRQLASSGSTGEVKKSLQSAQLELKRTREILERLRDFVSQGKIETEPIDLAKLAASLSEVMRVDARAKGVQLSFDMAAVPTVQADSTQIEQVMLNLVGNAVDAAADRPEKNGAVTVRTCTRGQTACIEVEDNGPGIAPDVADHLFEPFVSSKSRGLGLGLALARQIVDAHGGRIWWEPVHPTGSRFVVQLNKTT